ncbi:hypothetical protein [Ornithinimicrobium kibberense]|uniref:hypothetical protein n=1 Tax=Ornithinimicrobium kibberense TaxID=282060 RepID=UPI00360E6452
MPSCSTLGLMTVSTSTWTLPSGSVTGGGCGISRDSPTLTLPCFAVGSLSRISLTCSLYRKMPATLANSRFDRKPRRTTSRALNTCGNVSTLEASSWIIRPSVSSPKMGKKFSNVRMFSRRASGSPEGFGCRLFANSSKILSVRSGAKSKM